VLFECEGRPGQSEIKIGQKEGEYTLTFTSSVRRIQLLARLLLPDCWTAAMASWEDRARYDFAGGAHTTRRKC